METKRDLERSTAKESEQHSERKPDEAEAAQVTGFFVVLDFGTEKRRGFLTCNMSETDAKNAQSGELLVSVSNDKRRRKFPVESSRRHVFQDLGATFIELTEKQVAKLLDKGFRFMSFDYSVKQDDDITMFQYLQDGSVTFDSGKVAEVQKQFFFYRKVSDKVSPGSPIINRFGDVVGMHCRNKKAVKVAAVRSAIKSELAIATEDGEDLKSSRKIKKTRATMADQNLPKSYRNPLRELDQSTVYEGAVSRNLVFCFGGIPGHSLEYISIFSPTKDSWYEGPTLLHDRCFAAAAVWNNSIVITGGYVNRTNAAELYDPESNTCNEFPDMIVGRWRHALVNLKGTLYAIGGYTYEISKDAQNTTENDDLKTNSGSRLDENEAEYNRPLTNANEIAGEYNGYTRKTSPQAQEKDHELTKNRSICVTGKVEKFGICSRKWEKDLNLIKCRAGLTANTVKGAIVVAGGFDGEKYLKSCEIFDSQKLNWSQIQPMKYKRCEAVSATFDGIVFVFGGEKEEIEIQRSEQYDIATNTWTLLSSLINFDAKFLFAAATLNNAVYLLGAHNSEMEPLIECFNLKAKRMISSKPLKLPSAGPGLGAVGLRVSPEAWRQLKPLLVKIRHS